MPVSILRTCAVLTTAVLVGTAVLGMRLMRAAQHEDSHQDGDTCFTMFPADGGTTVVNLDSYRRRRRRRSRPSTPGPESDEPA